MDRGLETPSKGQASRDPGVIVGGVLGSISHPEVVIAGLYTADGELVNAKPGHPWPDEITAYRWGGPDAKKPLIKVQPSVVVEVTADAATQGGQVRHGMRYVRVRADLSPDDLPHALS